MICVNCSCIPRCLSSVGLVRLEIKSLSSLISHFSVGSLTCAATLPPLPPPCNLFAFSMPCPGTGHQSLLRLLNFISYVTCPAWSSTSPSGINLIAVVLAKSAGNCPFLNLLLSDMKQLFPFLLFCFMFVINWFVSNDCPIHLATGLFYNLSEICHQFSSMFQPLCCLALRINLSKHFNFSFSLLFFSLAYYFL